MRPKQISRHYVFSALSLICAAVIGGWVWGGRLSLFHTTYNEALYQTDTLWLDQGAEVKQTFISRYPGLSRIDVLTVDSPASTDAPVIFQLKETCEAKQDLRKIVVSPAELRRDDKNNFFYSFTFNPLDESANRSYCFTIEARQAGGEGSGPGIRSSNTDLYREGKGSYTHLAQPAGEPISPTAIIKPPDGQLTEHSAYLPLILDDGQAALPSSQNFDIGFQLYYSGPFLATVAALLSHLIENKPYFWGSGGFYLLLLVVYLLGVILFLKEAARRKTQDET